MNAVDYLDRAAKELAEIAKQEKALAERKTKLRLFAEMGASLFGEQPAVAEPAQTSLQLAERQLALAVVPKPRKGTAKAIVEQVAAELLANAPFVQTDDVLAAAEAAGARIGAANKPLAVSAILSRAPQFQNDRSKGWFLKVESPNT